MTYGQLKSEVLELGFERDFPSDGILLSSLNRALLLIAAERGVYGEAKLGCDLPHGAQIFRVYRHIANAVDLFPLVGRAYSFTVSGEGSFTVTGGGESQTTSFSGDGKLFRGFLPGEGQITFLGNRFFTVYHLTVFPDVRGGRVEDIPAPDGRRQVDMRDLCDDFLCFAEPAQDENGQTRTDVLLENGKIILPANTSGEITIRYRRRPTATSGNNDLEQIDVPPECESSLPLLVAFYVWLDDDDEKAGVYLGAYREAMAAIRRSEAGRIDARYRSTNGW